MAAEEIPQNETPEIVADASRTVVAFLQSYGWFVIFGVIVALFLKSKLEPYLELMRKKREREDYEQVYDATTAQSRQEAMEAHRRKLQEQLDAAAALNLEAQKQKEEEKRKQKIEDWERHQKGGGYRSKVKQPQEDDKSGGVLKPKNKKPLAKPDYNPLMGSDGGSCSWRPGSRRGGAGGGG